MYPKLNDCFARLEFNLAVYDNARSDQLKREEELAQISGLSGMAKML